MWERKVRAALGLSNGVRLVLFILATYMDKDGSNCRPTLDHLAHETGIPRSTLAKNIKTAEQLGWLDDSPSLRGGRRGDRGLASIRKPTIPESSYSDSGRPDAPESSDSDYGAVPESESGTPRVRVSVVPESRQSDSTKSYQVIPPPRQAIEEDETISATAEDPPDRAMRDSFGDRLRSRSQATWSDSEIASVLPVMTDAFGGGVGGTEQAEAALMQLALRTHNPVKSLRGFILKISAEDLACLPQWRPPREAVPVKPIGCSACSRGWAGEDDEGRPRACDACKPHLSGSRTAVAA